jgi:transcriptional regulator GlxA family with amidase domain
VQATSRKPSKYQQRLRVTQAREMLEFSRKTVDGIALSVGYDDARGFRRAFHKIVGLTPYDYRPRSSRLGRRASD